MNFRMMAGPALLAVVMGWAPALSAQQPATPAEEARCRHAEDAMVPGASLAVTDSALQRLSQCGSMRLGGAIALAVRQSRTSTDSARLELAWRRSQWLLDGRIFHAALDIAGDSRASGAARLHAFRALLQMGRRRFDVRFAEPTTDGTRNGVPGRCTVSRRGYDYPHSAAPVPADAVRRIRAMANRVLGDPASPPVVHAAAECILQNVGAG